MHLLAAQPGAIADGSEAVDLGQTPGDVVVLSAADTELASLSEARGTFAGEFLELRLANVMQLSHNLSVDIYLDEVLRSAKLVVVRLLGGAGYWAYGFEQLQILAEEEGFQLAFLPGDDQPDAELAAASTLSGESYHRLWQYLVQGGPDNAKNFVAYAASLIGKDSDWLEPVPLLRAGLHWPGLVQPDLAAVKSQWIDGAPVAAITFYKALVQAGNLAVIDQLVAALTAAGVNALPVYVSSLKDPASAELLEAFLAESGAGLVLNGSGFAVSSPGAARKATPFDKADCPVFQIVFAGSTREAWEAGDNGLAARDIAMNVALPEVDGRLITRAVSFKGEARFDPATQCSVVAYEPHPDRLAFVAQLAANWLKLRSLAPAERRVALVLANYPNRDGRLGNGVGLDTPAGTAEVLKALAADGYEVGDLPASGDEVIDWIASGPTNAAIDGREIRERLTLEAYQRFFSTLPEKVQREVTERWGTPDKDPFFMETMPASDAGNPGEGPGHPAEGSGHPAEGSGFALPLLTRGKTVIGLQPARGYNIDPTSSYHDPDLVPPHGYLAFYAWLRGAGGPEQAVQAVVHLGKHGNMEWLPGKSLALSADCYPEAVFGPLPHLYPFIVNDPGEGTQAKRRAQAVIIDHLTPPLTRAETYGPLADLERLVDEYYEAAGVDPRRLLVLREEILELTQSIGLDKDIGIVEDDGEDEALGKLDNYLCELKELQIRDGLHIFGKSPEGDQLNDLLVALVRVPRGTGLTGEDSPGDASLIRVLAKDLGVSENGDAPFDPLDCQMSDPWGGKRPAVLKDVLDSPWRSQGDTLERLELLALDLVTGERGPDPAWEQTRAVLAEVAERVRPAVESSGQAELAGLLTGLDGRFVAPGASGAPTRGRLDVLPTGRNFYSVDSRTVPTPAAWTLGWKSATRLLERHRQEQGEWLQSVALSAWGTSNMRTGGDDIAQALALMGVRPTWDAASRRVTGFEVLPADVLGRPRVDVTLRISGFFRDAFPSQIDLFDSAVRAVTALDEPASQNPLAARAANESARLVAEGVEEKEAHRRAGFRVFGSMPGAYGAGLQALIDEKGWETEEDLARAYVAWGGYAYGAGGQGKAEHGLFEQRLGQVQAVLHNQDNREHDLLDSDDYYQFEGGMTAAVKALSGQKPKVYHNDHSRPERPVVRTLEEEIARVVRARVVNPKWIAGVMRHDYKGAFEMAATVDYLFAFAATTGAVADHHFDAVYEAYLEDSQVREFLERHNPEALKEMAARLQEALDRGLWQSRSNRAPAHLMELQQRAKAS
ncbi:cobaltochelatase subunit CobN [Rhodovibrionaceae bacterium A322]